MQKIPARHWPLRPFTEERHKRLRKSQMAILDTNHHDAENKTLATHSVHCLGRKHFHPLGTEFHNSWSIASVGKAPDTRDIYVPATWRPSGPGLLVLWTHRGLCSDTHPMTPTGKGRAGAQRGTSPGTLGWKTLFRSKEEALEWVFCGRGGGVGGSSPLFMASSMEVLE